MDSLPAELCHRILHAVKSLADRAALAAASRAWRRHAAGMGAMRANVNDRAVARLASSLPSWIADAAHTLAIAPAPVAALHRQDSGLDLPTTSAVPPFDPAPLIARLPHLASLVLDGTPVLSLTLTAALAAAPQLSRLSVARCVGITPRAAPALAGHPTSWLALDVSWTRLDGAAVRLVADAGALRRVRTLKIAGIVAPDLAAYLPAATPRARVVDVRYTGIRRVPAGWPAGVRVVTDRDTVGGEGGAAADVGKSVARLGGVWARLWPDLAAAAAGSPPPHAERRRERRIAAV
ncbi:hypothetical protein H9P43_004590 [Blastocladiella emersonii ATCC 22665]|nr:hypothetical protein H9P43_004590 [Blastocladiella emersonii ATCC 22665]